MSHVSNDSLDEDSFFSEILSSQSNIEEQILQLKEIVDSDDHNILNKLNELQNFLSNTSIQNVPIDILDEKVFNTALTYAQKIYYEVIKVIEETLKGKQNKIVEDVKNQLNMLTNILKCWDLCINHIKSLEKVSIIDIKSFPVILFDVMISALNHCKNSTKDYGDYFQSVSDLLTSLFRQCVNTLNSFYVLMDSVISFDTNQEEGMKILMQIIDETGKVATLTNGMDAKTLAEMWKRFGKLSTMYALEMKNISPNTVSYHFKGLSESIINILSTIDQKNQRSSNERCIMCCRLLLKILEKLCGTYCGWIRNNVMIEIVIMLTHLFRYTEQYLKISGYNADFNKFIASNFTFMIDPFIDVVLKNDSFKMAFFDHGKNISQNVIDYHLLLLTIMKKLSTMTYEVQREWCNKEFCIFDICFQNIDKLTKEICLGKHEIQISHDIGQGSYITKIYEATCLSIFALVCQIPDTDFSELILVLLKYLLSGKFFASLLSSDVWCFVCRLGSSDMCYELFQYLLQIYEMVEKRENDLNVIMLSNLLSRQYTFLSDKDKICFINSIDKTSDPCRWRSIARIMDTQKKKEFQQKIEAFDANSHISDHLKTLEDHPTLTNFSLLTKDLSTIEVSDLPQDEQSIDSFKKMWNKIVYILGDCEGMVLSLLEDLATSLIRAIYPQQNDTKYMTSILESMASLYPYASSRLHLEFTRFLNRCAMNLTDEVSNTVAELFCRLLNDSNSCVQQQAFESFEYLTRACPNTNLISSVALAIKNLQSEISRILPDYISGKVAYTLSGFKNHDEFFVELCSLVEKMKHVCHKRNQIDREEKLLKLDEDGSINDLENAQTVAERICSDMELVLKFKGQLKANTHDKLRSVCQKFLDCGSR